jgi:hypothetical protein
MNMDSARTTPHAQDMPNGPAAAAILAAGIGCFMIALFALMADKIAVVKSAVVFYKPTGPLSGVTTCAILVWLISWAILNWLWGRRMLSLGKINAAALVLLGLALLLTFPPIVDLF